jgi:hypothetical protein
MKLTVTQRRLIVAGIGVTFIVLGIIQGVFKVKINKTVMNEINFALMVVALWAFISGRKATESPKPESAEPPVQPETNQDSQKEAAKRWTDK